MLQVVQDSPETRTFATTVDWVVIDKPEGKNAFPTSDWEREAASDVYKRISNIRKYSKTVALIPILEVSHSMVRQQVTVDPAVLSELPPELLSQHK